MVSKSVFGSSTFVKDLSVCSHVFAAHSRMVRFITTCSVNVLRARIGETRQVLLPLKRFTSHFVG